MFFHKRNIVVVLTALAMASFASSASATTFGAGTLIPPHVVPNVFMDYGYNPALRQWTNTVEVYTDHGWLMLGSTTRAGGLVLGSTGAVTMRLTRGEQFLSGFADYGTAITQAFGGFRLKSAEVVPPSMTLTAGHKQYRATLSNVYIQVFQPGRPEPPEKGGSMK